MKPDGVLVLAAHCIAHAFYGCCANPSVTVRLEMLIAHVMPYLVSNYTCPRAAVHRRFSVLCAACVTSAVWAFGGVYQQILL